MATDNDSPVCTGLVQSNRTKLLLVSITKRKSWRECDSIITSCTYIATHNTHAHRQNSYNFFCELEFCTYGIHPRGFAKWTCIWVEWWNCPKLVWPTWRDFYEIWHIPRHSVIADMWYWQLKCPVFHLYLDKRCYTSYELIFCGTHITNIP